MKYNFIQKHKLMILTSCLGSMAINVEAAQQNGMDQNIKSANESLNPQMQISEIVIKEEVALQNDIDLNANSVDHLIDSQAQTSQIDDSKKENNHHTSRKKASIKTWDDDDDFYIQISSPKKRKKHTSIEKSPIRILDDDDDYDIQIDSSKKHKEHSLTKISADDDIQIRHPNNPPEIFIEEEEMDYGPDFNFMSQLVDVYLMEELFRSAEHILSGSTPFFFGALPEETVALREMLKDSATRVKKQQIAHAPLLANDQKTNIALDLYVVRALSYEAMLNFSAAPKENIKQLLPPEELILALPIEQKPLVDNCIQAWNNMVSYREKLRTGSAFIPSIDINRIRMYEYDFLICYAQLGWAVFQSNKDKSTDWLKNIDERLSYFLRSYIDCSIQAQPKKLKSSTSITDDKK